MTVEMKKAVEEGNAGEYLGDIEITHEMMNNMENVNRFSNRIHGVTRGKYMVTAFFDLADGHFIGLALTPDEESAKPVAEGGMFSERQSRTR